MSNIIKKLVEEAIETSAENNFSEKMLFTLASDIKSKHSQYIKDIGVYQDKKTKMKCVIASGKVNDIKFVFQFNANGLHVASVNGVTVNTDSLPVVTVGAALIKFNRVIERASISAKAINAADILKDKIVIKPKEEASDKVLDPRIMQNIREVLKTKNKAKAMAFVKDNFFPLRLKWSAEDKEFVVTIKGDPESDYFTNDLEDALITAYAMYRNLKK